MFHPMKIAAFKALSKAEQARIWDSFFDAMDAGRSGVPPLLRCPGSPVRAGRLHHRGGPGHRRGRQPGPGVLRCDRSQPAGTGDRDRRAGVLAGGSSNPLFAHRHGRWAERRRPDGRRTGLRQVAAGLASPTHGPPAVAGGGVARNSHSDHITTRGQPMRVSRALRGDLVGPDVTRGGIALGDGLSQELLHVQANSSPSSAAWIRPATSRLGFYADINDYSTWASSLAELAGPLNGEYEITYSTGSGGAGDLQGTGPMRWTHLAREHRECRTFRRIINYNWRRLASWLDRHANGGTHTLRVDDVID
jgi:hypothetical protein